MDGQTGTVMASSFFLARRTQDPGCEIEAGRQSGCCLEEIGLVVTSEFPKL